MELVFLVKRNFIFHPFKNSIQEFYILSIQEFYILSIKYFHNTENNIPFNPLTKILVSNPQNNNP